MNTDTHPFSTFLFAVGFFAFAFFMVLVVPSLILTAVFSSMEEEPKQPKPYDPMICYVITAEGERVSCP